MRNVRLGVDPSIRLTEQYESAKLLYEEKRLAYARINEINKRLREISNSYPDAVQVAQIGVPLRKPQGTPKQVSKLQNLKK